MEGIYQHHGFAVSLPRIVLWQMGTYEDLRQIRVRLFVSFFDEIAAFLLRAPEFDIVLQFSFYVVFQYVQRNFRLLFLD